MRMASEPRNWSETADPTGSPSRVSKWVLAQGKTAWKLLVYSSAYLAILASLEVLIVQMLLSLPPSPAPVVVGLITFAIYSNDRLVDLSSDAVSNPQRTAFMIQYQHVLYVLAAAAYGSAVALSAFGGPIAFGLALVPGIAWVLYAVSWVPAIDIPFQRLKEPLIINSAIVAVAWSLTVVFLPVAFAGVAITPAVLVIFGYLVLGTFVCTEISNVKDIESDIRSGVSTLPTVIGVSRTRHVLYGISVLVAVMVGHATVSGYLTTLSAGALLLGLVSLTGIVWLLDRTKRDKYLSIAAECTRLPVLGVLIVASHAT